MKYSNELKVGATIIIATVIFILGVRYFEDLPLFRGTYDLETELANAGGLIPGNAVRVAGVTVGSVDKVFISPESNGVRVLFHVDSDLPVTEGTVASISGLDALGVVRLDLTLGEPGGAKIPEGGFVAPEEAGDLIANLTERAPGLVDEIDGAVTNLNAVLGESRTLLSSPDSELQRMLVSARRSVDTMDNLLRTQRDRIASVLVNVDEASGQFSGFLAENSDSLSAAITTMNDALASLDATLANLDTTADQLSSILAKVDSGQGTLGRLLNDDAMYQRTDSLLTSLESLIVDFQENPGRYLREMRLVDLF